MSGGRAAAPPERGGSGALGPLGPEGFRRAAGVSRETLARLERYAALLEKWSRAINLVGRDTLPDLWRRHMLDSAQLMDHLPPPPPGRARRVLDLGSGAGFPGLVLAILGAGELHLVEADGKKCGFLREAARATAAEAVVHQARLETLARVPADVVTARALAPLPRLLALAEAQLVPEANRSANKIANKAPNSEQVCSVSAGPLGLFLKGRDAERELTDSEETWMMRAEVFPSRSDPRGRIVRVSHLARKEPRP